MASTLCKGKYVRKLISRNVLNAISKKFISATYYFYDAAYRLWYRYLYALISGYFKSIAGTLFRCQNDGQPLFDWFVYWTTGLWHMVGQPRQETYIMGRLRWILLHQLSHIFFSQYLSYYGNTAWNNADSCRLHLDSATQTIYGRPSLNVLCYAILVIFPLVSPFLVQIEFHKSPIFYGRLALLVGLTYLLGSIINRFLLRFFAIDALITSALCAMIILNILFLLLSLVWQPTLFSLYGPILLIVFSISLIFPNCMGKSISFFPQMAGKAPLLSVPVLCS